MKTKERTADPLAKLALLVSWGVVFGTSSAYSAAAEENGTIVESRAVESNGVTFVIGSSNIEFTSPKPLALRMTFRNTTAGVIWLPRGVYALHFEDTVTGKSFTGVVSGASLWGNTSLSPIRLDPQESQTLSIALNSYGFVEGTLDYGTAQTALFEIKKELRISKELRPDAPSLARNTSPPQGVYKLVVEFAVQPFYRENIAITWANAPLCKKQAADGKAYMERLRNGEEVEEMEINIEQCRIDDLPDDFDPAFLWKDNALRSNPIELKVAAPELEQ